MPEQILVVGSINMDHVITVPRLPLPGETLPGAGSVHLIPGGKGANQAVASARAGGHVIMAGRVGNDSYGVELIKGYRQEGIETELIMTDPQEASGIAIIFLLQAPQTDKPVVKNHAGPAAATDNAIVVSSGANGQVGSDPAEYERIHGALQQAQALILQLEIPQETVSRLIQDAHKAGVSTILNLAPMYPLPDDILRQVAVLVVNEIEASALTAREIKQVAEARAAALDLHRRGIATVVITLGSLGAVLVTTDEQEGIQNIYQPAPRVAVVDTTAAGDCFVGALTVALTEGCKPVEALQFACAASTLKVTRFGAQSGLPTRSEIQAMLPHLPAPDFDK